jgi:hypothetical protein
VLAIAECMKFTHALLAAAFCAFAVAGCLDDQTDETDSGSSDGETWECVPFATCDSSTDESETQDPEDETWECIPFLTC